MSSNGVSAKNEGGNEEIVLRDLQTLLRKSIGKEVEVVNYVTSLLLAKGENYASTMLKVDAKIKRTRSSPVEELPLVAKMIPTSEFHKSHFNCAASFIKELFFFEKLLPVFRQIEEEAGLRDKELIDVLPKCYGGRLTRNEETPDKADADAVMLMENLKLRGYSTMNRMEGLDFSHAKLALTELARFHALGMAVKWKRPEFFEASKPILNKFPFELKEHEFDDVSDHIFATIFSDKRIVKYKDRIMASMGKEKGWEVFKEIEATEPWITVIHGDFWVNNMLFHEVNGKVDDVKFVDFQVSKIYSPLKDLPYFMCASLSPDVIDNHFDDLLDVYYERLVEVLGKVGCDTSPITREGFEEQLRKDAKNELMHCLMALKFFTLEVAEEMDLGDIKSTVMMSEGSQLYIERSWKIVSKFVERRWI